MAEKLYRSTENRMLAGVCGGIAEHLKQDPTLVRVIAVVVALGTGAGFLGYLVAWLLIPERPAIGGPTDSGQLPPQQ